MVPYTLAIQGRERWESLILFRGFLWAVFLSSVARVSRATVCGIKASAGVVTFSMDLLLQLVLVDGLLLNASFKIAPSSALAKLMMCFFITGQITSMKYFFI
ncbi:hypothetical protein C2U30_19345 [Aeromonas sp. ASNIH5]|nr:hypothetical protein C2U30_19345 [Aeromonas sp. ASNIH5]